MKIMLNKGYIISGTTLMAILLENNPRKRSKIIENVKPQEVNLPSLQQEVIVKTNTTYP
jgi:hypothetical protein